jgi:hypothetical protein
MKRWEFTSLYRHIHGGEWINGGELSCGRDVSPDIMNWLIAGVMSLRAGLMSRSADILSASAAIVRGLITSDADGSIRSALLDPEVCESLAGAIKRRSREGAGSSSLLLYSVLNLFCDLVSSSSSPTSSNQRGGASSDLVLLATEGPGDTIVRLLADNIMMTSLLGHASRPVSALASKLLTFIIDGSNQEFVGCMQVRDLTHLKIHQSMYPFLSGFVGSLRVLPPILVPFTD